jgi:acetone carboxylase, beta subunit
MAATVANVARSAVTGEGGEQYFVALDAGGTMTDAVVVDSGGTFLLGKALTDPEDESVSFLESVADAAVSGGRSVRDVLSGCESVVYAGTVMLNTLLTRSGQTVGLIVTRGLEDYLLMERGEGPWLALPYSGRLHSATHLHNAPYIPKRFVRGVRERIDMFGNVVIPLHEEEVRRAAGELLEEGAEVLAIAFVFSYLNGVHEQRAAGICAEAMAQRGGTHRPVVLSSEVSQTNKEYSRLVSVVAQAYAGERARGQFLHVETRARDEGYGHNLLTLLSHGGVVDVRYPRLYESYISGPVGGVLGARFVGEMLGVPDLCCADVGGTSLDVGLIKDGLIPISREPVLIQNRANLATILTQSIGAGTGSVITVDPITRKIDIGPESAGSRVGYCYRYDKPTISDCQVVLGYLNPDNFLGGTVKLDPERALEAVSSVAEQIGSGVHETAFGAIELLHESMRQHLTSMLVGRGHRPQDYTLLSYGGGGPLHMWGLAEGMQFGRVLTFPFAAVFSAFGILTSDYAYRYHKGTLAAVPPGDEMVSMIIRAAGQEAITTSWQELEERAYAEMQERGIDKERVALRHFAYVRYAGQLSDHEVLSPVTRLTNEDDLRQVTNAFERVYESVYPAAAKYPEAGYQVMEVAVSATVSTPKPALPTYPDADSTPPDDSVKGQRQAYFKGHFYDHTIYDMDRLMAGNVVQGPAIVEHPATTLVVPPGFRSRFDERRFIWFEPVGDPPEVA